MLISKNKIDANKEDIRNIVIANYLDSDNFFLILSYLILSIICTGLTIYIMGLDIGERQYVVNAVRKFIKK